MDSRDNAKPVFDPEIFRANVEVITDQRGTGWVADHLGMKAKIIYRWLKKGIKRPDLRTQHVVEALAKLAELEDWQDLGKVRLVDHRKANREAHENLDRWLADPFMVDATKAALKALAHRSVRTRTVSELLRPFYCKLSKDELNHIGARYTEIQIVEAAIEVWEGDRDKFSPAEFLRSLAKKSRG